MPTAATACLILCHSICVQAILCRSRHWAQISSHSPRTTEKLKPRFVFISETQYGKRSFLSENIKELGLLRQYFYFKTARSILYTCLHLSISFSNLISKEIHVKRGEKIHAFEIGYRKKAGLHFNPATFTMH